MRHTKKAVFSIAVLGFALALAGCRDITPDLHDIHTVTLNPGMRGAVDGRRQVVMDTDVWGRLSSLPVPQSGQWNFECYELDEWGFPHTWPARCEYLGCANAVYGWSFEQDPDGRQFAGWFTGGGRRVTTQTVFDGNTLVVARWLADEAEKSAPGSVAAQLADLRGRPGLPPAEVIMVSDLEWIEPQVLDFGGTEITITLTIAPDALCACGPYCPCDFFSDDGCPCTPYVPLQLRGPGAMFTVGAGVTLILANVELHGFHRNNTSIIVVESGGTVHMHDGTLLAWNNTDSNRYGGGVTVHTGGTFVMEGGKIFQNFFRNPFIGLNLASGGGGVLVRGGTFIMRGGSLEENIALSGGGGVRVNRGGTFIMEGGRIYDNASFAGGGVMVSGGADGETDPTGIGHGASTFIMRGRVEDGRVISGTIEGNFSPLFGSGVSVGQLGRFYMYDGLIVLNEGNDGVGVDNDSGGQVFMMAPVFSGVTIGNNRIYHEGAIILNDSLTGGTGGVANFWMFNMDGGIIALNQGGFGGGVRNFSDFVMFDGAILGNRASGPAGGIVNVGNFRMHGGQINHNTSVSEGGGIVHGQSGRPYLGNVLITGGIIWNNRDLSIHHIDGLPGSMGNIRRSSPRAESFSLARLGFYSLNSDDHPGEGWGVVSGVVPIFRGEVPGTGAEWEWYNSGRIPASWETMPAHFFYPLEPPTISTPFYQVFWTQGRPRVEIGTEDNPFDSPTLVINPSVPAMSNEPNIRDRRPIPGGVTFPSSLPTQHMAHGFVWVIHHGFLEAIVLGSAANPVPVTDWPVPPSMSSILMGALPPPSWPWAQATGAQQPLRQWHPPMAIEQEFEFTLREHPAMENLRLRHPELYRLVDERVRAELPLEPVLSLEQQVEMRRELILPHQLKQRLEQQVEHVLQQQESGRQGGFSTFAE